MPLLSFNTNKRKEDNKMGTDIYFYVEKLGEDGRWYELDDPRGWYGGRNYDLFAILANVRNGYAVAGIRTGDGFSPLGPRGLPRDVREELRGLDDEDFHSQSWISLREILEYDWDQETTKRVFVRDTDDGRFPSGGRAKWAEEYANHCGGLPFEGSCFLFGPPPEEDWKEVTFKQTYAQAVGDSDWWGCVMRMYRASGGDLDSVRGVFAFNS
jgi:hypothetical protein